jgi:PDZ domain-containing protein
VSSPAARVVGALSRRVRTLIVSGLVFLVLLILALTLPVPYVILSPGPTCNTLGTDEDCGGSGAVIIKVQGVTPRKTNGNLNLTTVGVSTQRLSVFDALSAWLQDDQVVVPKSSIYPPGQSQQQVDKQNTEQFSSSQDNAVQAAACELGYPKAFGILGLSDKSPSSGKLKVGDAIVSVAGQPADTYAKLKAILEAKTPGSTVPVVVTRGAAPNASGTQVTTQVTLGPPPKDAKGASLGIIVSSEPVCLTPYTVDLGLGGEIGGPSAGLMFALGIIDKVGPANLTDGRFIAGTGTIDPAGNVGAIGGIQLKMIAARDKGASVFLAPADNCGDVRGDTPSGLQVVKVSTLHEAVQDLGKLENHQTVPGC